MERAKLELSPKRADQFSVIDLLNFTNKFLNVGATHHMIQCLGLYNSSEEYMKVRRMVKAWKDENPLAIFTDVRKQWEMIYDNCFPEIAAQGIGIDQLSIPEYFPTEQIILIEKNATIYAVLEACKSCFKKIKYNSRMIESLYDPIKRHGTYGIRTKKLTNAHDDNDLAGKTNEELLASGRTWMTLTERLMFELYYFVTTGKHLDCDDWSSTLCTGSYFKDLGVPIVRFHYDTLFIDCIPPDIIREGNDDRPREVTIFM